MLVPLTVLGGIKPVAETIYARVSNYIIIITPNGDTIRRPIHCPPGSECDTLFPIIRPEPGEWYTSAQIARIDTQPPELPRLTGCKKRFGKRITFILDTMTIGNLHYTVPSGIITNYLDSARYYGSKGIKFYVRTNVDPYIRLGVWLYDKNNLYVTPEEIESSYKKGLNLVDINFYKDLVPGDWHPPPAGLLPPDIVQKMVKPRDKLLIEIYVSLYHYEGSPLKVEVSELCLY